MTTHRALLALDRMIEIAVGTIGVAAVSAWAVLVEKRDRKNTTKETA